MTTFYCNQDAVNISVSLPKQPPLTTSTPYQPALRPCAKEKEPEEQSGQEDNVQVIQDSQPLSDTQEEMECPSVGPNLLIKLALSTGI